MLTPFVAIMRNVLTILGYALVAAWPSLAGAQGAPTRDASASSATEDAAIRNGATLHDQGKYDDAIALYDGILKEHPDNMTALYEKAYSLAEKKDFARSIEAATLGTQYRSEQLSLFYDLLGSAYDQLGDPKKAIDAYSRGVQVVPDGAMLYYNMAVTYLESLKDPDSARRALEKALVIEPTQPPIHVMLGQVFQSNGYAVPGFFAFATYLVLDPAGPEALRAYGFLRAILRGGVQTGPSGMQVSEMRDGAMRGGAMPAGARSPASTTTTESKADEGDFSALEAQLAASQRNVLAQLDAGMPEIQALVGQIDRLLTSLAVRDLTKDTDTFSGRHYLPYFAELKKRRYVEPFVYWAIQRAPVDGVRQWLEANQDKVNEFLEWTKRYKWPEA